MKTCEICQGRKTVNLPRYRKFEPFKEVDPTYGMKPEPLPYMQIACPECTDQRADDNRMTVLHSDVRVTTYGRAIDPRELEAHGHSLAHALASELLRRGLIDITTVNDGDYSKRIVATVGAIAPSHVATLTERIERATLPAIEKFADKAMDKISIWGRDIGRSTITKDEAIRFINEAVREWRK